MMSYIDRINEVADKVLDKYRNSITRKAFIEAIEEIERIVASMEESDE